MAAAPIEFVGRIWALSCERAYKFAANSTLIGAALGSSCASDSSLEAAAAASASVTSIPAGGLELASRYFRSAHDWRRKGRLFGNSGGGGGGAITGGRRYCAAR